MADYTPGSYFDGREPPEAASVWDIPRAGVASALDVPAQAATAAQYGLSAIGDTEGAEAMRGASEAFHGAGDLFRAGISEGGQRAGEAKFFAREGEPSVLDAPVSSLAMKGANMAGPLMTMLAFPGSAIGAGLAGGGFQAAQVIDAAIDQTNRMDDAELQQQSPVYAKIREGMDEASARAELSKMQVTGKDLAVAGVIGALGMGATSRTLKGVGLGAGHGALPGAAVGAAEGAVGRGTGSADVDYTMQRSQQATGMGGEVNWHHVLMQGYEGMVEGGIIGGAGGAVHGRSQAQVAGKAEAAIPEVDSANAPHTPVTGRASAAPAPVGARRQPATATTYPKPKEGQITPVGNSDALVPPDVAEAMGRVNEGRRAIETPQEAAPTMQQVGGATPLPPPVQEALGRVEGQGPSQPAPEPALTPLDTAQNIPETPDTLTIQRQELADGKRPAIMYPAGTKPLPRPKGVQTLKNDRGTFHYNPKLVKAKDILTASRMGRENEVLGLGPVSKPEVDARVAAGEAPLAVTERTPEGIEVKAAVGTEATAPEQLRAIEAGKATPENTVRVEPVEQVVAGRLAPPTPEEVMRRYAAETMSPTEARQGRERRVLRDVRPEVVAQDKELAREARERQLANERALKGPEAPKGKNRTGQEKTARAENNAKADAITEASPPTDVEVTYASKGPEQVKARAAIVHRARAMVDAARAQGLEIPRAIRDNTDEAMNYSPRMVLLAEAQALLAKKSPMRKDFDRFVSREKSLRAGQRDDVLGDRRTEGDIAKRKDQAEIEAPTTDNAVVREALSETRTPEDILAENESREVDDSSAVVTGSEEEVYARGRDRSVKAPENAITPVASQEGKFKVEAVKRRPTVKPGVGPKGAAVLAKTRERAVNKDAHEEARQQVVFARADIERNPSDAQKEAGNYAKGHVTFEGYPVTLENAKGSTRRGVGPDGRPWSVKLPYDYGYIKRTEGADGDHVDVIIGRHGETGQVFIVNQIDPKTGKFDEHKVIMGEHTLEEARELYKRGFSDGSGESRIGSIVETTPEGLREWVGSASDGPVTTNSVVTNAQGRSAEAFHSTTGADALDSLQMPIGGVAGHIFPMLRKRLKERVGDIQVHFLSEREMAKLYPDDRPVGAFDPITRAIYVDERAGATGGGYTHVVMHELTHAATWYALERSPHMKALLARVAGEMRDFYMGQDVEGAYGFAARTHSGEHNVHEFMTEALSNRRFQRLAAETPISSDLARQLNLTTRPATVWTAIIATVRKLLGMPPHGATALDAVLRISEHVAEKNDAAHVRFLDELIARRAANDAFLLPDDVTRAGNKIGDKAKEFFGRQGVESKARRLGDKASTLGMLAQRAREYFGPDDPAGKVAQFREMMRVEKSNILEKEGGNEVVRDLADLERAYAGKGGGGEWERAVSVAYDATIHNVNPWGDNRHLGKDATRGWQAKKQLPRIQDEFNSLPADLREGVKNAAEFFKKNQNKISLENIRTILNEVGIHDDALAKRIHEDGLTEEDRAKFQTNTIVNALNDARELKQIQGAYFPLRRYGDWVVNADKEVKQLHGTLKVADDTLQVTNTNKNGAETRRRTRAIVQDSDLKVADVRKVWVDKNDPTVVVEAENPDGIIAYRIRFQNQHTSFHESEFAARQEEEALRAQPGYTVRGVELKALNPNARNTGLLTSQMESIVSGLQRREGVGTLSPQARNELIQTLHESSIRLKAGARIQSTMLPRRNVAGFSKDLLRATAEYADMAAGYLSRLRYMPQIEVGLRDMREHSKEHRYESSDRTLRRSELFREIESRVYHIDDALETGTLNHVTRRLLQMSMLDKLGGISFHVINAMEPVTTAAPIIGGRHGFYKSLRALNIAYRAIGAGDMVVAGLKDVSKAFSQDHGFTDYLGQFKARMAKTVPARAKQYGQLLDFLHDRGLLDKEAGFEVSRLAHPESNRLGRALDRADLMARQMGIAIESINRAVTGIAAYEMEFRKTGDHQKSLDYAYETVHDTMGNYAKSNAAPMFNHPLGRLTFQFRKFAQKTYYLLGKIARKALAGDKEAQKQFAGVLFTHGVLAGVLGLPLEPIKVGMIAANALGAATYSYEDFEELVRETASRIAGKTGGEILARGAPRALGVDLSQRVGLESLITFGQPRSEKRQDIASWLFDTMAGAPVSTLLQQVQAMQALFGGDFVGATKAIPVKGVHDIVAAGQGLVQGKKTARGFEAQSPYSPFEAAVKAIGFKPAREAEIQSERNANWGDSMHQKRERDALVLRWIEAKPADRQRLWGEVERWNKSRPTDARLTRVQLQAAAKRRKTETEEGNVVRGQRVNKQNKYLIERNVGVYNTQ